METGKRYALIIANFKYDNIPDLHAPEYDAEKLKEVLSNPELGGFECELLINESSSNVQNAIEDFYDKKVKNDVLLLYYSGHGIKDNMRNLHLTFKETSKDDIVKRAVEIGKINNCIKSSNAKRHIIILDCCYSGAAELKGENKSLKDGELENFIGGEGRVILASSSKAEVSYQNKKLSCYTEVLIEGIETGEADKDCDGKITVDELHRYICGKLKISKPEQRPRIISDMHDSFVISKSSRKKPKENFVNEDINIEEKLKAYKYKIAEDFKILGVVGFKQRFLIDGIYIPLTMHFDEDSKIRFSQYAKCKLIEKRFVAEDLLTECDKAVVVLGKPGMGKTTMLKYLGRIESKKEKGLTPVFIKLSDFSKKNIDMDEYILQKMKGVLDDVWIKNEIFEKNGLVLLDGLDEVHEDNYNDVVDRIKKFVMKNSNCKVIITSRDARYQLNTFSYCVYEINKLPSEEIDKYIDKWFVDVDMEDKELEKNKLKKCIKENKRIYELAENPFLLSIICVIYENDKNLPGRRVELYERCTATLLTLYDIYNAEKKNMFTSSLKEKVLEDVAKYFFERNLDEFQKRKIDDQVEVTLKRLGKAGDEEDILAEICENSGILQKSNNKYLFVHRTFYEYYVASKYINDENLGDSIIEYIDNAEWEEVIRLYAGMLDNEKSGTDFIRKLWDKNNSFAIRCYADMNKVDPELIKELLKKAKLEEKLELVKGLPDKVKKQEKIVETLKELFKNETNGEVLYWGFEILENREGIKELDEAKEIIKEFEDKAVDNYNKYMKKYMVEIPAGEFMMGDDSGNNYEKPVHKVKLDGFKMSKFIVTNELYEKFDPGHKEKRGEYSDQDKQPVIYVNWYESYMFCRWCGCKLPTEAQWEYACRAGTNTKYNVGNKLTSKHANFNAVIGKTSVVGKYKENKFGLYDMHGNTFEWCFDWYDSEYYKKCKKNKTIKNPVNKENGSVRVIRGGSWYAGAGFCRSACRFGNWFDPGGRFNALSFRPAVYRHL